MDNYQDIINLPYVKSKTHKHMSNHDRAAQFAPFAALTGYEDLIVETARRVEKKKSISREKKEEISRKLQYIVSNKIKCVVKITYFKKDKNKDGGEYIVIEVTKIKIDTVKKVIVADGTKININDIYDVESDIFDE